MKDLRKKDVNITIALTSVLNSSKKNSKARNKFLLTFYVEMQLNGDNSLQKHTYSQMNK